MSDLKSAPSHFFGWKFKPSPQNWVAVGVAGLSLLIGVLSGGVAGFLIALSLVGIVTAGYAVITGRGSWASIPSRKFAGIAVFVSFTLMFVGGGIASPKVADTSAVTATATATATPIPSAAPRVPFTEGDPGDPATATVAAETASVVIADNSSTDTTAIALLATIPVKGKAPKTGYDRTGDFGTAWLDVDRNGCDTRNDILARDLLTMVKAGSCKVLSGTFNEPYTGASMSFLRGVKTSSLVQIDHVVALSNAWQTGAQQLTEAQRISIANDPLNLLAVDGRSNMQKGDGDTATWLPSNKSYRCAYVSRQVSVKATYGLWVTQAEHDAMVRVLTDCPDVRAITSVFAPVPAVAPAPVVVAPAPVVVAPKAPAVVAPAPAAPAPAPAPAQPSVYYQNCTAVKNAGAAPIYRGQPGYSSKLDRDGDGVACET